MGKKRKRKDPVNYDNLMENAGMTPLDEKKGASGKLRAKKSLSSPSTSSSSSRDSKVNSKASDADNRDPCSPSSVTSDTRVIEPDKTASVASKPVISIALVPEIAESTSNVPVAIVSAANVSKSDISEPVLPRQVLSELGLPAQPTASAAPSQNETVIDLETREQNSGRDICMDNVGTETFGDTSLLNILSAEEQLTGRAAPSQNETLIDLETCEQNSGRDMFMDIGTETFGDTSLSNILSAEEFRTTMTEKSLEHKAEMALINAKLDVVIKMMQQLTPGSVVDEIVPDPNFVCIDLPVKTSEGVSTMENLLNNKQFMEQMTLHVFTAMPEKWRQERLNLAIYGLFRFLITFDCAACFSWTGMAGIGAEDPRKIPFNFPNTMGLVGDIINYKRANKISATEIEKGCKDFSRRAKQSAVREKDRNSKASSHI